MSVAKRGGSVNSSPIAFFCGSRRSSRYSKKSSAGCLFRSLASKKGAAAWLSWVLIVSLSVGLGAMMFKWMTGFTESTTKQISSRVEQSDCSLLGVSVIESCQTVEELRLNLENKKSLNVNQIVVNYVDIYDNPGTKTINVSLRVNKPEKISILKQGIIKQFEIVPKSVSKDKVIICNDNTVVIEKIKHCS